MNIVQVITRRYRRGAEVFATVLSDALARRGHDVEMVALYAPLSENPLTPEAAAIHDLGHPTRDRLNLGLARRLGQHLRQRQPDVVMANGSDTFKYTALAKTLVRGDWPLVYRNISVASEWQGTWAHVAVGTLVARAFDRVTSVADEARDDFAATFHYPTERAFTIRRGIDITEHDAGQARRDLAQLAGISAEDELLIHIGSFTPEKNHRWMLDAFADIARARPRAHLILLGDGTLRPEIERRVADGLAGRVHPVGTHPEATRLVAGADVLLLPSLIEGIPGVVLEAAAQGVPAVATDVGGISEAVDHGESGMLVAPGNHRAFVDAVVHLLEAPEERARMGGAARTFVHEHYGIEKTAAAFERLYEEAVREKRGEAHG